MPTARHHFGGVRKLPSGRYQARYFNVDQRFTAPDTFATKAEALAWLAAAQTDIRRGTWTDPVASALTLNSYGQQWLEGRSDLRITTKGKYTHLLNSHILPILGNLELSKLAPSDVRRWYQGLSRDHETTADDAYRLLRAIVNTAIADNLIVRSPCQVKGAGHVRSPERPIASVAEVANAVEAMPDRYRLAILLLAWCQLRRGEVLALQRRQVDEMHNSVRINQSWAVSYSGNATIGPPKTAAGVRTLAVPAHIVPVLHKHLDRWVGPAPEAWLFGTSTGTAISARNFERAWAKARLLAGRPDLHLHDLRHSGLTWSAATGATTAELMRRGGHASPRAALKYQHATQDRDRALADALAELATGQVVAFPGRTAI
jgi:integrase